MANAIREKWKNNWPDAYASPDAFREYIMETDIHTLAQFIPPLLYLRSEPEKRNLELILLEESRY